MRSVYFLLACLCLLPIAASAQTWTSTQYAYNSSLYVSPELIASNGQVYAISSTGALAFAVFPNAGPSALTTTPGLSEFCFEGADGNIYGFNQSRQLGVMTLAGVTSAFSALNLGSGGCPIVASDGNYYGISASGGVYGAGFLYQVTSAGTGTVLYDFSNTFDGRATGLPLTDGSDGNLYGFSSLGLFRFGATTGIEVFPSNTPIRPDSAPLEGPDGNFYTFESGDGQTVNGEVLQVTPTGQVTTLYTVDASTASTIAGLTMGGDGNLYEAEIDDNNISLCANYASLPLHSLSLTGTLGPTVWSLGGDGGYGFGPLLQAGNGAYYGGLAVTDYYYLDPGCESGSSYSILGETPSSPPASTPITMNVNATHVVAGGSVTLNWAVNNAFNGTLSQCYGYGVLNGKLPLSGTLTSSAPAGTYTAAIVCGGTETNYINFSAGPAQVSVNVNASNPLYPGDPVQVGMGLSPMGYTPAPTGSVSLYYGSVLLYTQPVSQLGNPFDLSSAGVPPGTYTITAVYPGDANYNSSSASTTVTLSPPVATTMSANPTSQSVTIGRTATLAGTVRGTANQHPPSGTMTFSTNGTVLNTYTISPSGGEYSSTETLSEDTLGAPPGTYTVDIAYSGDRYNLPSSTTALVTLIQQQDFIALTATPNPVPPDTAVTLSATVTGNIAAPTGDVAFYANGSVVAGATLNSSGQATVQVPASELTAGTYQVQADYVGDANNPPVTSSVIMLTVQ